MHLFALRGGVIVAFVLPKLFYIPNLYAQLYHEIILFLYLKGVIVFF